MVTADVAEGQLPLLTVHRSTLVPVPSDVTEDEKLVGAVTLPEPDKNDQAPVPSVGCTALSVAAAAQTDWSLPALAVACSSLVMVTVPGVVEQPPLGMVHTNVLIPGLKELTEAAGLFIEEIVPEPEITDQVPLPTALSVATEAHTVWSLPAWAVKFGPCVTTTEAVAELQLPLETVHINTFAPIPKEVIAEE